jgi:serine protease AprX
MKLKRIFLVFLLFFQLSLAQEDAWVYFKDKPNAASFLQNPSTILTQRALERRAAQGITLNETDAPIEVSYSTVIENTAGIVVMAKSKWLNALHVRGSQSVLQSLGNLTFVKKVEFANRALNARYKAPQESENSLVNKTFETTADYNYGNSSNQIQMVNGHLLHQQNYTGAGKIIAVLDSGFSNVSTTAPFQRLFANNQIMGGYNFVNQSDNVFSLHNHGTLVLSCMGGFAPSQLIGTAPDASYYLFVTEDVTSENPVEESYWVAAAEEADRLGADIITSSLGYFEYDNPNYSHTYEQMTGNQAFASRGANMAFSKGIVVVASAGNSGATANPYIGVPAEATHVLAVGAVKADRSKATFSSIGPSFDGRVKPDIMAQGQASVVANTSGLIATANGTSFSCPIMAGVIASFWSAVPELTAAQVVQYCKEACDRYTNPNGQFGYGIPDFQKALSKAMNTENFSLLPNPVVHSVSVTIPVNGLNNPISFYDISGKKVKEVLVSLSTQTIDLSTLQAGLYFYEFSSKTATFQGKIIKK